MKPKILDIKIVKKILKQQGNTINNKGNIVNISNNKKIKDINGKSIRADNIIGIIGDIFITQVNQIKSIHDHLRYQL